jgi:hypothetical protein
MHWEFEVVCKSSASPRQPAHFGLWACCKRCLPHAPQSLICAAALPCPVFLAVAFLAFSFCLRHCRCFNCVIPLRHTWRGVQSGHGTTPRAAHTVSYYYANRKLYDTRVAPRFVLLLNEMQVSSAHNVELIKMKKFYVLCNSVPGRVYQ